MSARIATAVAHALTWALANHDDANANRAQAWLWGVSLFVLFLILLTT
jgi:hypothetical protein